MILLRSRLPLIRQLGQLRCFSSMHISEEVRNALNAGKPVVSLESTIITHGLPYPQNLEMALDVEKEIRSFGVIPATTAFIKGVPKVGLTKEDLEHLAQSNDVLKVSRRDIPYVMANNLDGGTTISGTMILSHKAGIKIFATGGLGGVHRNGENTMDVSADLDELGKTPVAVICAGPKSILDIGRTMEYLETKGVFVGTYGPEGTNIPGFYTRDSGVKSVYNFQDFKTAANVIKKGKEMGLDSGFLFCVPPPEGVALDSAFISGVIDKANKEAEELGIKGKETTPYLLKKIAEVTKGESVKSNIQFVLNNARSAAQIALEYYRDQPTTTPTTTTMASSSIVRQVNHEVKSLVIGSIALDTYSYIDQEVVFGDSNPGKLASSIGGVGYNVALESSNAGNNSLKFVSIVGDDVFGDKILRDVEINASITQIKDSKTSQYISFHDKDGELVIATADMNIIENNLDIEIIEDEIKKSNPTTVLTDLNISLNLLNDIIKLSKKYDYKLIIEPTSFIKSKKLANAKLSTEAPIYLSTPTVSELNNIYANLEENGKFELDMWFPIIDKLGVDGAFRSQLDAVTIRNPAYKRLIDEGTVQIAVSCLPFINNLVVKDGANGVYLFSLLTGTDTVEPSPDAELSLKSKGSDGYGILFEHFKAPSKVETVKNVTGAGDTLIGSLLNDITKSGDVFVSPSRGDVIQKAQKAAIKRIIQ